MPSRKNSNSGVIAILGALLLVGVFSVGMVLFSGGDPAPAAGPSSTPSPTRETFSAVYNNCENCGSDGIHGVWETNDGRSLAFFRDGTFILMPGDGTSYSGNWDKYINQICLTPVRAGFAGEQECVSYEQKVDAMKFSEAIYIRRY